MKTFLVHVLGYLLVLSGSLGETLGSNGLGIGEPLNCTVYNWQRMICHWNLVNLPENDQISLGWKITGLGYFACPHSTATSCEWRKNDENIRNAFKVNMRYKLLLYGKNQTYYREDVHTSEIVKPAPVRKEGLQLKSPSSRTLQITGSNSAEIGYMLLYLFRLEGGSTYETRNSTSLDQTFTDLAPYTRYTVAITCMPYGKHQYVSDAIYLQQTTLMDVPDGPPGVTLGGFWQKPCTDNNTRDVIVYLQPIDNALRNAPDIRYNVCQSEEDFELVEQPKWNDTSLILHLDCGVEYNLKLCGESVIGLSHSPAHLTIGSSTSEGTYGTFDLIAEEDKDSFVVNMEWPKFARDNPDVENFAVYYCRGRDPNRLCEGNIEWVTLPPSANSHSISFTKDEFGRLADDLVVGLSADFSQTSSGILWSPCVFTKRADLTAPQGLRLEETEEQTLVVEWTPKGCEGKVTLHPFVRKYRVLYCETSDQQCTVSEWTEVFSEGSRVELKNVQAGKQYAVAVQAVLDDREGPLTDWQTRTVSRTLTAGDIVGIVVAGIVLLCFSSYGLVICYRWIKQKTNYDFACEIPEEVPDLYSGSTTLPGNLNVNDKPVGIDAPKSDLVTPNDALLFDKGRYLKMAEETGTRAVVGGVGQRDLVSQLGDKTTGQQSANHMVAPPSGLETVGDFIPFKSGPLPCRLIVKPISVLGENTGGYVTTCMAGENTGGCVKTCMAGENTEGCVKICMTSENTGGYVSVKTCRAGENTKGYEKTPLGTCMACENTEGCVKTCMTNLITATSDENCKGYVKADTDNRVNHYQNMNAGTNCTSESTCNSKDNNAGEGCVRVNFYESENSTSGDGMSKEHIANSDNRSVGHFGTNINVGADFPIAIATNNTIKEEHVRASFDNAENLPSDNGIQDGNCISAVLDSTGTDLHDTYTNVGANFPMSECTATNNTLKEEYVRASSDNSGNSPSDNGTREEYITATDFCDTTTNVVADCPTSECTYRDNLAREEHIKVGFDNLENLTSHNGLSNGYITANSDNIATELRGTDTNAGDDFQMLECTATNNIIKGEYVRASSDNSGNSPFDNGTREGYITATDFCDANANVVADCPTSECTTTDTFARKRIC